MFVAKYLYLFVCMFVCFVFLILPSLDFFIKFTSLPLLFLSAESSSEVQVGIDELMNITVSLENSEENSYNTHVILTYPAGLSYRKLTILQVSQGSPSGFLGYRTVFDFSVFCAFDLNKGRIECNSLDSDNGLSRGKTDCTIDKPIFRSKIKVGRPLVWLYRWTAAADKVLPTRLLSNSIPGFLHCLLWDRNLQSARQDDLCHGKRYQVFMWPAQLYMCILHLLQIFLFTFSLFHFHILVRMRSTPV